MCIGPNLVFPRFGFEQKCFAPVGKLLACRYRGKGKGEESGICLYFFPQ